MTVELGSEPLRVAVLGGTGRFGGGLALRFAAAGHRVTIGSRSPGRAIASADAVRRLIGWVEVHGSGEVEAIEHANCVLLAVPPERCVPTVQALADTLVGKVLVSCANPLPGPGSEVRRASIWPSAAELVQHSAPGAQVVAAFHHLPARRLADLNDPLEDCDILVCADDPVSKAVTMRLASAVTGRPGVDAGSLAVARQLEAFTQVLITVGRGLDTLPGLRVTRGPRRHLSRAVPEPRGLAR